MKKLISLFTIVLVALVASQAIDAKLEKKRLYQKNINGVEIIVGEYRDTNDKNYQFYVGAINNTQTNYYVTIEMDVHKEGEQNKSIRKSSSVNPGQQKVLWDTRDKVKDFKVKDVRLTKL